MAGCPICAKRYYDIDDIGKIHSKHGSDWIVTVCRDCGRNCISRFPQLCENCLDRSPQNDAGITNIPGKHDMRTSLRADGQEGTVDYFGSHEDYI